MQTQFVEIDKEKEFEPFQITITVESIDELKLLWCRLNTSIMAAKHDNQHVPTMTDFHNTTTTRPLFELLQEKREEWIEV